MIASRLIQRAASPGTLIFLGMLSLLVAISPMSPRGASGAAWATSRTEMLLGVTGDERRNASSGRTGRRESWDIGWAWPDSRIELLASPFYLAGSWITGAGVKGLASGFDQALPAPAPFFFVLLGTYALCAYSVPRFCGMASSFYSPKTSFVLTLGLILSPFTACAKAALPWSVSGSLLVCALASHASGRWLRTGLWLLLAIIAEAKMAYLVPGVLFLSWRQSDWKERLCIALPPAILCPLAYLLVQSPPAPATLAPSTGAWFGGIAHIGEVLFAHPLSLLAFFGIAVLARCRAGLAFGLGFLCAVLLGLEGVASTQWWGSHSPLSFAGALPILLLLAGEVVERSERAGRGPTQAVVDVSFLLSGYQALRGLALPVASAAIAPRSVYFSLSWPTPWLESVLFQEWPILFVLSVSCAIWLVWMAFTRLEAPPLLPKVVA